MKIIKWKAKWFKNLSLLYKDNNLITTVDNLTSCNPSRVFINPKDATKLHNILHKEFKKDYPYLSKHNIQSSVAAYLLNLEPVNTKGITKGWILII